MDVDLLWRSFCSIYTYQIIMLDTLDSYNATHWLHLNKPGKITYRVHWRYPFWILNLCNIIFPLLSLRTDALFIKFYFQCEWLQNSESTVLSTWRFWNAKALNSMVIELCRLPVSISERILILGYLFVPCR